MMSIWGAERSSYHGTCVRKVYRYLKKKCSIANYEESLVTGYITDAWGYNRNSKIWYLCEIKVNESDLQKAPKQIFDTVFHFPKTKFYHRGDTVVPVIAFPARLQKELVKFNTWDSLRNICRTMKVAIWVIEQSTIREVTRRKTKVAKTKSAMTKAVKAKQSKTKSAKTKTTIAKAAKSRLRTVKSTKARQTKAKNTKRSSEHKSTVKARKSRTAPKKKRS